MDWTQFVLLVVALTGLDFLSRKKIDAIERRMESSNNSMLNIIIAIKDDIKDFHGRLCSLEERRKEK